MTQEERSIRYVLKFEKLAGRNPKDVSKLHIGYDVKSGSRYIEVKSRPGSRIQPFILLQNTILRTLGRKISNFYIYIVYDMKNAPKLVVIDPEAIFKNLVPDVKLRLPKSAYGKIKFISLK